MTKEINDDLNKQDEDMSEAIETFETRWRYAVFPAMIAFVILAGFGFYLIYGMLQRMEDLAADIDDMSKVMIESLPVMQGGVVGMSSRMQWIGEDLRGMREDVNRLSIVIQQTMPTMEGKVGDMSRNISNMTYATSSMAATTQNMGQNLWNMNRNFSKPLSFMRKMMPWGGDKTPPPPRVPQYNTYLLQQQLAVQQQINQEQANENNTVTNKTVEPVTATTEIETEAKLLGSLPENLELGRQKFVNLCASCHGTNAEGGVGPSLTNYTADQIETIFQEYRSGNRAGTMLGIVKTFTAEDVTNIAKFLEVYSKER